MTASRPKSAGEKMWSLVPAWTRAKDRLSDGVLKRLTQTLGVGIDSVEGDVRRLLNDMFVDTCSSELIPLIGDLVAESLDPRVPVRRQRYQVKYALHWRRRKGTPAQLEALAWIISGFNARVLEPPNSLATNLTPTILGSSPIPTPQILPQVTFAPARDRLQIELDVAWPVRRRQLLLTPIEASGADLHAVYASTDVGLRRADGAAIFRSDDPQAAIGPGRDIEIVGVGGDLSDLGPLMPQFTNLGGRTPPSVPPYTLAVDPERGRVAGPTAVFGAFQRLRRYRLHFWEPLRAEQVEHSPRHLGNGIFSFTNSGAEQWLVDEQAQKLEVHHSDQCSGRITTQAGTRLIVVRLGSGGCFLDSHSAPFIVLSPGTEAVDREQAIAEGLPLDTHGLRRFFAIEDSWGWDVFRQVRLVRRFSREPPPDDTVEIDLRHGRFHVNPAHIKLPFRVRYFRPYDIDGIRSRVRDELLQAIPIGQRAIVTFRDTAVPGHIARTLL